MRVGSRERGAGEKPRRMGILVLASAALVSLAVALPGIGDEVEPTEEPISAQVQPSDDRRIESRLRATFSSIGSLGGVEVTVTAGVVQLRGEVLSQEARELAARLAKQVEGVVAVENHLTESFSLERRLDVVWKDMRDRAVRALGFLPLLLVALLVLAAFVWLARAAGRRRSWFERVTPSLFLQDLLAQVVRAAVLIVGVLLAL